MTSNVHIYQKFIEENLEYMEELQRVYAYWKKIESKRVFDVKWSDTVSDILKDTKQEITRLADECYYYIIRAKEQQEAYVKTCKEQLK